MGLNIFTTRSIQSTLPASRTLAGLLIFEKNEAIIDYLVPFSLCGLLTQMKPCKYASTN